MQYKPEENARGVWGLEDRLYTEDEIAQSFHLQSAVHARALVLVEGDLSADNLTPPRGAIRSDGAEDIEARLAAQTLRQRRHKEN